MSSAPPRPNAFLTAPLGAVFARTALPIILVMSVNGLLTVVDAIFLGVYVGADAVSAITVIFPLTMATFALSTLVTAGMASLLARRLGAGDEAGARDVFASAHGLSLCLGAALAALLVLAGWPAVMLAAGGNHLLAAMAWEYLAISMLTSPLMFVLSLHADGLRNEGRAGLMALLSVFVSLANIALNYLLIAVLELGVAGSALGTALAQALALALVLGLRLRMQTPLPLSSLLRHRWWGGWGRILALGAPPSLGFLGIGLISAVIVAAVQVQGAGDYAATTAAYGIVTRVLSFGFLPLMGLGQAMQAIVGNNVGAGQFARSDAALKLALGISALYCLLLELVMQMLSGRIGGIFVDDPAVIAEVTRILPVMTVAYVVIGPNLMLASYFQSIGDAPRAAVLSLTKPFLLAPLLIATLSAALGEPGIWLAPPLADALMAGVALVLLWQLARGTARRPGPLPGRRGA
ncbi:MATE family efflux transporter [Aquicoccus sp. SCR17]|nr:MATE family efflux transporter [Carideicomes alvinocaridis]